MKDIAVNSALLLIKLLLKQDCLFTISACAVETQIVNFLYQLCKVSRHCLSGSEPSTWVL